jgi:hypothetical protein
MDIIMWLIRSALTIAALLVIVGFVAALFMVFFRLATGIDDTIAE